MIFILSFLGFSEASVFLSTWVFLELVSSYYFFEFALILWGFQSRSKETYFLLKTRMNKMHIFPSDKLAYFPLP